MSLHVWSTRWLKISLTLLFMVMLCSFILVLNLLESQASDESYPTINQVRLKVNPLLLELEQNHHRLHDPVIQEKLRMTASENNVPFSYVGPDGVIVLSSDPSSEGTPVNLRSALHYNLADALQLADGDDSLNIAFPVMDGSDSNQIGNAIFTVPRVLVFTQKPVTFPLFILGTLIAVSVLLGIVLFIMARRVRKRMLTPVDQLKQHAESILKGQYDEQIQHNHADEIGSLYAMLDLMRTEIKHLSEQRIRQEKAQKELITNISHDLKTPITTVKAYIEAISEGLCSNEEMLMEYIGIMRTHTDKTARLVEDLLIHALQELGQISVDLREIYSHAAFENILRPIGHIVRIKGLIYEQSEPIPNVLIRMDPVRIEQVISNLVSNALKHTVPGDHIRIQTELVSGQFKVTIADSGQGIQAQDMPFVFDRYFRGNSSLAFGSKMPEGTGLGLSICKSIIEAHGTQIHFSSKPGQGTIFQFSLPLC